MGYSRRRQGFRVGRKAPLRDASLIHNWGCAPGLANSSVGRTGTSYPWVVPARSAARARTPDKPARCAVLSSDDPTV